jgi:hypothetical protein
LEYFHGWIPYVEPSPVDFGLAQNDNELCGNQALLFARARRVDVGKILPRKTNQSGQQKKRMMLIGKYGAARLAGGSSLESTITPVV